MKKDHYSGALLEIVNDQYKAIREGIGALSGLPDKVDKMADNIEEIKTDIKAIKAVVKDYSHQLDDHESRISQLEAV